MSVENLILFRHAKAEDPFDAPSDEERALTAQGKQAAAKQAQRLHDLGVVVDVALVSSANRTRQTWQEASTIFPGARVETCDNLYLASPRTILDVAKTKGAHTTVIVGHNPGIHLLACDLLDSSDRSIRAVQVLERFKTAEIAWFVSDIESRTDWSLLHFLTRDR